MEEMKDWEEEKEGRSRRMRMVRKRGGEGGGGEMAWNEGREGIKRKGKRWRDREVGNRDAERDIMNEC